MISQKKLDQQLKKLKFNPQGWGRTEAHELCNVLHDDEEIEELVNGYYEAGFALLVATKNRLILVDKKPLNYLTIEDMRFDMISEFDYSHRLFGAHVSISTGSKTFKFTSVNQPRLRSLVTFVQNHMSHMKNEQQGHQETQQKHLEEMNERLQQYLEVAHKQQFMSQARAIATGQPPSSPDQIAPAAMLYGQSQAQPMTPFEQAASTAFDQINRGQTVIFDQSPAEKQHPDEPEHGHVAQFMSAVPRYSHQALRQAEQIAMTPQQIGLAAARRVVPVVSAYSRLPLMSQRRRYYANQNRMAGAA